MSELQDDYDMVSDMDDETNRLYEEMEACEEPEEKAALQQRFDDFMKITFVPKVSKIFAKGPLTEELYHTLRELHEDVNQKNQQIEWLYSTSLYLGYEDLEETGSFQQQEPPFSAEDIDSFPQLAQVNESHNAYDQKNALYGIVAQLEAQVSTLLSEIHRLLQSHS